MIISYCPYCTDQYGPPNSPVHLWSYWNQACAKIGPRANIKYCPQCELWIDTTNGRRWRTQRKRFLRQLWDLVTTGVWIGYTEVDCQRK